MWEEEQARGLNQSQALLTSVSKPLFQLQGDYSYCVKHSVTSFPASRMMCLPHVNAVVFK